MKIMNVILFFFVLTINTCAQRNQENCIEKINLINQIISNPDSGIYYIKKSIFYDESLYGNKSWIVKRYNILMRDYIKKFKRKCVLSYTNEMDEEFYTINYIGIKDSNIIDPNITFPFIYQNNKWVIGEITYGNRQYLLSSKKEVDYFNEDNVRRESKINYLNKPYFNYEFLTCEKINFINEVLNSPNDFIKIVYNYNYIDQYNKGKDLNLNMSFNCLKDYMVKYKDSCRIWINYPYPVDDIFIENYLIADSSKDYFIVKYFGKIPQKVKNGFLTFEFNRKDSKWYFHKIYVGTNIFIALEPFQYLPPYK
jgi:hypothetical protein